MRVDPDILRAALTGAALEARYQPVIGLANRLPIGLEALARLTLPSHGRLSPDAFIPLIEQAGLIAELTDAIAARALTDYAGLSARLPGCAILVNVPLDVLLVPDALARLEQRRAAAGVAARNVVIELTERHAVEDLPGLSRAIDSVRAAGCGLALDDIVPDLPMLDGLLDLPFTMLKLDRSIVQNARRPGTARDFAQRITDRAHARGQMVIAEGMEDPAAWNIMAAVGVHAAQGYLLARPMQANEVADWCADWLASHTA